MNVQVPKRFISGQKKSKKDILIDNILQLRPEFTPSQLRRLDLPTLNIILDDSKQLMKLNPQKSDRKKYIADILRFASRIDTLEIDKLSTSDLKFLSMGF